MASVFSHAISGIAIFSVQNKRSTRLLIAGIICTVLPDIDILAFDFGIPYGDPMGHRGITHSLFFAIVLAFILKVTIFKSVVLFSRESLWIVIFLFICGASHGLLDAMTNGGKGVGFFIPFDNQRYFLPFRPIQVSPIGASRFFSEWGWKVIKSEMMYVGIPSILVILLSKFLRVKTR